MPLGWQVARMNNSIVFGPTTLRSPDSVTSSGLALLLRLLLLLLLLLLSASRPRGARPRGPFGRAHIRRANHIWAAPDSPDGQLYRSRAEHQEENKPMINDRPFIIVVNFVSGVSSNTKAVYQRAGDWTRVATCQVRAGREETAAGWGSCHPHCSELARGAAAWRPRPRRRRRRWTLAEDAQPKCTCPRSV